MLKFALIPLLIFAVPASAQQRWPGHEQPKPAGHALPVPPQPGTKATTTTVKFGLNGHEGRATYPLSGTEARMQWMQQNKLVTYRTDVGVTSIDILDHLVPLAKKYGIVVRPMLYPGSQQETYTLAKRFAADIKVWEIGNELDAPRAGAQDRINAMMQSVRGVEQAEAELHAGLKTSINIMACNNDAAESQCAGDPNGDVWFLDMAKASGWHFSYVTFHYYPNLFEPGFWMDKYFGQMKHASQKFGVPIFLNEFNCGEIYSRAIYDGAGDCNTSLNQAMNEVINKYADIVQEVNVYEMLDQPDMIGVEQHFGVCYQLNNCKPTKTTLTTFAAMTSGTTPPVIPPEGGGGTPTPAPPYTGTVTGTFTGTVTLTPVK
jgi:hypothetical protein